MKNWFDCDLDIVAQILHLAIFHGIIMMAHSADGNGPKAGFIQALSNLKYFLPDDQERVSVERRQVLDKIINYIKANRRDEVEIHGIAIRLYFYPSN